MGLNDAFGLIDKREGGGEEVQSLEARRIKGAIDTAQRGLNL